MILSLVAVLLIGAVAWAGAAAGHLTLLGMALPLFAAAVFICGFVRRVVGWAKSPVPFAIPTTGGQEKSLSWIRPNRLDTPMSTAGVVGRMLLEVLLFRSLFRNTRATVSAEDRRRRIFPPNGCGSSRCCSTTAFLSSSCGISGFSSSRFRSV